MDAIVRDSQSHFLQNKCHMKRLPTLMCAAAALALGFSIIGCSKKDGNRVGKGRVLVMVPKGVHPYYEPCYEGFKDAAAKYGVTPEYRAAKAFEVPQQVDIIENLIAR